MAEATQDFLEQPQLHLLSRRSPAFTTKSARQQDWLGTGCLHPRPWQPCQASPAARLHLSSLRKPRPLPASFVECSLELSLLPAEVCQANRQHCAWCEPGWAA